MVKNNLVAAMLLQVFRGRKLVSREVNYDILF